MCCQLPLHVPISPFSAFVKHWMVLVNCKRSTCMLYRLTLSLAKMLKDRLQDEDDQNYFVVEFQVKRSVDVNGFQECKNRIPSLWIDQRYC